MMKTITSACFRFMVERSLTDSPERYEKIKTR
jgi:hypothetical protein